MILKRFRQNDGGAVSIIVGLLAPVLLGFTTLAVDVGFWMSSQSANQLSSDAAAIAVARSALYGCTSNSCVASAASRAASSAISMTTPDVTASLTGTSPGQYDAHATTMTNPSKFLIEAVLGSSAPSTIAAASNARLGQIETSSGTTSYTPFLAR